MASRDILALGLLGLAALIACTNLYLSLLRYPLHRLRGGSQEGYRFVSGIPMVGTIALVFAGLIGSQNGWMFWPASIIFLADTGGLFWLLVVLVLMRFRPIERDA